MVRITGVLPDTNPIIVISVLREFSGYDLASAKDLWDRVASGEVVMVSVRHAMDIACADALTRCGVEAEATNRKEILREIHERDYRTYDPEVYWSVLKDDLENQIRTWSDRVDELQRLWPGEEPGNAAELVQRLEALRPFASELLKRHSVRCLYPLVSHAGMTLNSAHGPQLWCMASTEGSVRVERMYRSDGSGPPGTYRHAHLFVGPPSQAAAFVNLYARTLRRGEVGVD